MNKNAFGLSENVASMLCYAFGYVSGIVFLLVERDNKTIRFHALQSVVWFGFFQVLTIGFSFLFGRYNLFNSIINTATFISWVYLLISAYKGRIAKLPFVGEAAWNQMNK